MKIHEYQAKELLGSYGVPVPSGILATSAQEAEQAAQQYGACVVKAQVHSGGRGKAGGVKFAKDPQEAGKLAQQMLGMTLYTPQTGPEGKVVRKLLITEAVSVEKEYYLSITGDSERAGLVIIASGEGGTEIEETARQHPEKIAQVPVSVLTGLRNYEALEVARKIGLPAALEQELAQMLAAMTRLYLEKDCSLVEINPLVQTKGGHLLALDAKINFDDNALMRHAELAGLRDVQEEDPKEYRASQYDLNYVSLEGSIGCLVNGAGLAMATMDIIKKFGGEPANFLDVGGSATTERVTAAFEILLSDPNVKAIFVNIFGGIMKCDIIAEGIVAAAAKVGLRVPLVVRLEGTNVARGREILHSSGLSILSAADMADGARKAVACAKGESVQ